MQVSCPVFIPSFPGCLDGPGYRSPQRAPRHCLSIKENVGPSHAEPFTASPKHLSTPLFVPHTKLLFPFIAPGLHFPASAHQEFPKVCWTVCSMQRGRKYQLGCAENCLQPKTQRRSLQSSFRTISDFLLLVPLKKMIMKYLVQIS